MHAPTPKLTNSWLSIQKGSSKISQSVISYFILLANEYDGDLKSGTVTASLPLTGMGGRIIFVMKVGQIFR
jgi:hypothetical protein